MCYVLLCFSGVNPFPQHTVIIVHTGCPVCRPYFGPAAYFAHSPVIWHANSYVGGFNTYYFKTLPYSLFVWLITAKQRASHLLYQHIPIPTLFCMSLLQPHQMTKIGKFKFFYFLSICIN